MERTQPDFSVQVHTATHTIDVDGELVQTAVDWVAVAVEELAAGSPRWITINGAGVQDVDAGGMDQLVSLAEKVLLCGSQLVISAPSATLRTKLINGGCGSLLAQPVPRAQRT